MSTSCYICEEEYEREINPPVSLIPCGHVVCRPCIDTWRKNTNSCPECRKPIQNTVLNREFMNLMELNSEPITPNPLSSNTNVSPIANFFNNDVQNKVFSTKKKWNMNEIIQDKCKYAVYIIDNSQSMGYYNDGKIFETTFTNNSPLITKRNGILRWFEAVSKIKKIAKYNISRNMTASYYLLNPIGGQTKWIPKRDYITIDPTIDLMNTNECMNILFDNILNEDNIRGNTPLDVITKKFRENFNDFIHHPSSNIYSNNNERQMGAINYNIITDGEPNNRYAFENELRMLANKFNIFLTINLCTEDDEIVEYYNDLDKKLGSELSGMDVIDDLECEQKEILNAGNDFFVYSEDVHVCRMSGCYSIVADLMDETKFHVHFVIKLCNELCVKYMLDVEHMSSNLREEMLFNPWNGKCDEYVSNIKKAVVRRGKVYDFYNRKFSYMVDVGKLESLIWWHEQRAYFWSEYENARVVVRNHPLYVFGLIVVLLVFFKFYVRS